ncbi:DUF1963 domain-containing protein [Isoptericola croceus]|uniref:DUF1963 domain-containing protein n=1 Tax=Isoptericola croceus TaxID=3031406 RepID=UPI0023F955BC|nr:DUF1963 domain-containing protein [Isoptericola croceus]
MARKSARTEEAAPIHGTWAEVQEWLAGFGPSADVLAASTAWSPVFSGQSFASGREELDELWTTGANLSWLGGPAVGPLQTWPRNADGAPLAHVATISLADVDGASQTPDKAGWPDRRQGLPVSGVLDVFHDLQVYGWEAGDDASGGWLVHWIPEPDRSALIEAPDELDTPTHVCQPGLFLPGFSVISSLDVVPHGDDSFETTEKVTEQIQRAWLLQQTGSATDVPVPVTHVYGHSQNGVGPALEVLQQALPLREDKDTYRLVLDLESWTHLAGWFGDAAPLEIWMRQSDLDTRDFDAAWCITRTD